MYSDRQVLLSQALTNGWNIRESGTSVLFVKGSTRVSMTFSFGGDVVLARFSGLVTGLSFDEAYDHALALLTVA